jgi:hypothetical protein
MKLTSLLRVPSMKPTSSSDENDRGSGRIWMLAIALLLGPVGILGTAQKAHAFWPACSYPNRVDVGGNGTGPATVAQALRLAEIRLTHPSANFCSMITEYKVTTFIQWLD